MNGTVLIVDDEAFVRQTLRKMIESNETGWTVAAEAENGAEALERIREQAPDLVITDVRMPLVDGLEVAEWVHLNQERTKVVILTGYRDFAYAQAALRFGVVDFLLKPCPERDICALLKRLYDRLREENPIAVQQPQSEESRKQIGVIERAQAYMEQNYMDRCTLQMVAAHVYLNPNYFSELFKRETGLGFQQYLTQLRLEKAVHLLDHTDARVAEVARDVGYDDPNYFSTLFSKKYRMSPNEYRKRSDPRNINN